MLSKSPRGVSRLDQTAEFTKTGVGPIPTNVVMKRFCRNWLAGARARQQAARAVHSWLLLQRLGGEAKRFYAELGRHARVVQPAEALQSTHTSIRSEG